MSKTIVIELTSAIVWGGVIQPAGTEIEVTEIEARHYMTRGKAVLAEGEALELGTGPFTTTGQAGNSGSDVVPTSPLNTVDLSKLTVEQLHEWAKAKSFTVTATKKADIQKELQDQLDYEASKELSDNQAAGVVTNPAPLEPLREADLNEKKE